MKTIILDIEIDYNNKTILLPNKSKRSLYKTSCGKYWRFKLDSKPVVLHRYLAKRFIPNPDNLPQVNHIDGDTFNNNIDNLEWCTQEHNLHHAMDNGLHNWGRTEIERIDIKTGDKKTYSSQAEAGKDGFSQSNINKCLKGIRKHHKGFEWRYTK